MSIARKVIELAGCRSEVLFVLAERGLFALRSRNIQCHVNEILALSKDFEGQQKG